MLWPALFFTELIILFYLSRKLTKTISFLIYSITGSKKAAVHTLAFLFLPGTTIHEISHAVTAACLGVPVGKISLFPEIEANYVKLGSVQIAKTDVIRRFFIGTAPFIIGTVLLLGGLYATEKYQLLYTPFILLIGYGIFEVGNTMFSSRKDMEGAIKLLFFIVLGVSIMYLLNIQIRSSDIISFFEHPTVTKVFFHGSLYLTFPILLDILIITIFSILSPRR